MNKTESVLIAVFLCIACPFTFFVFGVLIFFELRAPESVALYCTLAGLGLGIIIVISKLKHWISTFYTTRKILAVPLYLFWCAVALSLFMGLPIGVIVLGALGGLYIGRQSHHKTIESSLFKKEALKVSLFTAAVTGFALLAMGLLAIQEQRTMQAILFIFGLQNLAATAIGRTILVAMAVPLLIVIQYWLTKRMAYWGFRLGEKAQKKK